MTAAARRKSGTTTAIDVVVDSPLWVSCGDAERIVRRAIEAAVAAAGVAGEIAVLLTDDAAIRTMNARWRGIDKPTNVLSFPADSGNTTGESIHLGDIAIAYETVETESTTENKTLPNHLAHLAVHGYLHLAGFDHETDAEAVRMENLETRILSGLGIADPYADRPSAD